MILTIAILQNFKLEFTFDYHLSSLRAATPFKAIYSRSLYFLLWSVIPYNLDLHRTPYAIASYLSLLRLVSQYCDTGTMLMACFMRDDFASRSIITQQDIHDLASNVRVRGNANTDGMAALATNFHPGPFDVICARGRSAHNHSGNRRMRVLIEMNLGKYSKATTRLDKTIIVSSIVDSILESSPSGGFVREEDGRWYLAGDHTAREKVGQG